LLSAAPDININASQTVFGRVIEGLTVMDELAKNDAPEEEPPPGQIISVAVVRIGPAPDAHSESDAP
jgi:cyclophilin family peptidyl-prolyl cis-trans isomerase